MDKVKSFNGNKIRCIFLKLNDNTDRNGFVKIEDDSQERLPFN